MCTSFNTEFFINVFISLPESVENPSPITLTQIQMEPVVSPMDEFVFNTPRITLQELKDSTTVRLCL
jgi:hypothetical protein